MKRIIYDVPRWDIYLHRQERSLPLVASDDGPDLRFEDELFARLYSGEAASLGNRVDQRHASWAKFGHDKCNEIVKKLPKVESPEIEIKADDPLAAVLPYCRGNAHNAAFATAWLVNAADDEIEEKKEEAEELWMAPGGPGEEDELATLGLQGVNTGGAGSGTGDIGRQRGAGQDSQRVEELAEQLKSDDRLRRIAILAGRFKQTVVKKNHTRSKSAEEITNIEIGGEIARLIPNELVKFVSPRLRAAAMRDLLEKKLLQYDMVTQAPEEALARGPIVLCLDKSGSMEGENDIWASAVALGILGVAHEQKRPFVLLNFDHRVFQPVIVKPGDEMPLRALMVKPDGGTDIQTVLITALSIIKREGVFKSADIILITDGFAYSVVNAPAIKAQAASMGVTIYGVGIGPCGIGVGLWCHEANIVNDTTSVDDETAKMLFSDRA